MWLRGAIYRKGTNLVEGHNKEIIGRQQGYKQQLRVPWGWSGFHCVVTITLVYCVLIPLEQLSICATQTI